MCVAGLPEATASEKVIPSPVRLMVRGLPLALSVIVIVAVRVSVALGVKVTLIWHEPLAATDAPHVFVWAKSPLFVPPRTMLLMLNAAVPLLVKVTGCTAEVVPTNCPLKVRVVLLNPTIGVVPVPFKLIVCGLPEASSPMLIAAVRVPVALGVNVTLIVQVPPAVTVAPHVVVWAKSLAFAPPRAMLLMFNVAVPLLVSVTD